MIRGVISILHILCTYSCPPLNTIGPPSTFCGVLEVGFQGSKTNLKRDAAQVARELVDGSIEDSGERRGLSYSLRLSDTAYLGPFRLDRNRHGSLGSTPNVIPRRRVPHHNPNTAFSWPHIPQQAEQAS